MHSCSTCCTLTYTPKLCFVSQSHRHDPCEQRDQRRLTNKSQMQPSKCLAQLCPPMDISIQPTKKKKTLTNTAHNHTETQTNRHTNPKERARELTNWEIQPASLTHLHLSVVCVCVGRLWAPFGTNLCQPVFADCMLQISQLEYLRGRICTHTHTQRAILIKTMQT